MKSVSVRAAAVLPVPCKGLGRHYLSLGCLVDVITASISQMGKLRLREVMWQVNLRP